MQITSFSATDNNRIAGYILAETSNIPNIENSGWNSMAPTKYTFSEPGSKTLYAWVKDDARNISGIQNASITITIPVITTTEYISICEGESYEGWTTTGQYERVLASSANEDSIVITNLSANPVN